MICTLARDDIPSLRLGLWLLCCAKPHFTEKVGDYTAFFFTKEMASEFISKATEACVAEINALQEENAVKFYNYAW